MRGTSFIKNLPNGGLAVSGRWLRRVLKRTNVNVSLVIWVQICLILRGSEGFKYSHVLQVWQLKRMKGKTADEQGGAGIQMSASGLILIPPGEGEDVGTQKPVHAHLLSFTLFLPFCLWALLFPCCKFSFVFPSEVWTPLYGIGGPICVCTGGAGIQNRTILRT